MTTETKTEIKSDIFTAFQRWINQKDRCDPADYGDGHDGRRAYWQEKRNIAKQRTRARKALSQAKKYEFNGQAMQEALRGAFSGRLSWVATCNGCGREVNGRGEITPEQHNLLCHVPISAREINGSFEYCTGQYFPTEFALAAAVVLESYVDAVKPKFTPTEEQQKQWWDIGMIERANENAGRHWFSPSTKRFFRSRVLDDVYQGPGGIFFVSSEKGPLGKRKFTVREFKPQTAGIDTFGPFNEMSRERAKRLARIAAEARKAAEEIVTVS